jgi:hypothetical protein
MKSRSQRDAAITGMREGGMTYRAIAEVVGLSVWRVWQIANREQHNKNQGQYYWRQRYAKRKGGPVKQYRERTAPKPIKRSYKQRKRILLFPPQQG